MMNKTRVIGTLVGAAIVATGLASAAHAQATQFKQHRDWGAYSYQQNGAKNCFVLSKPTTKSPPDRDHGDVYFMVARKADGSGFEPQFRAGYSFAENSEVTVNVDGKAFTMFTQGDGAWLRNKAEEPSLVQAMRAGRAMKVDATSRRGTSTSYDYSLSGVTAALGDATSCP